MRSALWEQSPGALAALLASGAPVNRADLYTLTLGNGTVYRWSGADVAVVGGGNTWVIGPGMSRGMARFETGISVDDLSVQMTDNVGTVINGQSLFVFVRSGGLIGSRMQIDKSFWPVGASQATGAVYWFAGRVEGVAGDRYSVSLTVRSDLDRLNINVPREIYQPQCRNTVYDSACTLQQSAWAVTGTATGASTPDKTTFYVTLAQADDWFDLGVVTFTSGPNAGITRSVKQYLGGAMAASMPWPFPVSIGDAFSVVPGCDGQQTTCMTKFSNLANFRGFPYIPQAGLILPGVS